MVLSTDLFLRALIFFLLFVAVNQHLSFRHWRCDWDGRWRRGRRGREGGVASLDGRRFRCGLDLRQDIQCTSPSMNVKELGGVYAYSVSLRNRAGRKEEIEALTNA